MNDSSGVGLRERKRAQTADAIHTAAAELVLERGLDAATIDAISERADVSNRTFFNYFSSKEDAVLGLDEIAVAAELDKARSYSGDPLSAVFDLVFSVFEASGGKHKKSDLIREVIRKNPQLLARQMVRVAELEDRLCGIITGWLAVDPLFVDGTDAERLDQARLILSICLGTVRMGMKRWANESDGDPGDTGSSPADPRKTYEHAIAALRDVLEKLV